jgi:hypothetical protein
VASDLCLVAHASRLRPETSLGYDLALTIAESVASVATRPEFLTGGNLLDAVGVIERCSLCG